MRLRTKVFELYPGYYGSLSQLAHAMGISVSQVCRVRSGKRNINQKFIIGALSAFPQLSFAELFYLAPEFDGFVTEEALRESEERYRAIFEQAADSVLLVDVETGAVVEFNDRAHETLGYTREEFKKLKIPDFEAVESAEEVAKHIEKVVNAGADTFETKHRTKGGKILDITEDKMYDYTFSHDAFTTSVLLGQAWQAMYNLRQRRLGKLGLTPEQTIVLLLCKYYPGPLIPAEIARMLFRKSQTIAGLLSRMEREGLVKRVPKRKGHPYTEVQITAEGEKRLRGGRKVLLDASEKSMSDLSAEEGEQLRKLLRKVRQKALKEQREELTPPPGFTLGEVVKI